jgi:FAD/FMN-containing dehydrogenase
MAALGPYLNGGVYQNYPWRGLADFETAFWRDDKTIARLRKVKAAVDPNEFFRFEQGITPDPKGSGGVRIEHAPTAS